MTEDDKVAALRKLIGDFPIFAAHCLKIKTKAGDIVPLLLNEAQRRTHELVERQLAETGKVRAIVLKYRQGGISTYIGGRFYWGSTTAPGQSVFVIAHEQKATDNLYSMVRRYHDNNPLPVSTGATNAKELIFDRLDGGYKLATAGTKDVGRSQTVQRLHASEYAFWANAPTHMAGIGNTVSDEPGTEIFIESTANGTGNSFHQLWQKAVAGENEWLPIFLPWFIQPEYRAPVRPTLQLSADDELYMHAYGLDMEQMQWRANKIGTYDEGTEWLFAQEYPATAEEAFRNPTKNPLISPTRVMAGVNSGYFDEVGPLIIGCDPAGDGEGEADRTAIVFRRGRVAPRCEYHDKLNTMQIAGKLAAIWHEHQPDALFIDKGGMGAGVVDRLKELNIPAVGINFAEKANDPLTYENKRAEMWWLMKYWFEDAPVRLVNDAALIADLSAPQPEEASTGRKLLESKKKMKARGIRSPDGGDALALTFAEPVSPRVGSATWTQASTKSYEAATRAGY